MLLQLKALTKYTARNFFSHVLFFSVVRCKSVFLKIIISVHMKIFALQNLTLNYFQMLYSILHFEFFQCKSQVKHDSSDLDGNRK